MSLFSKIFYKTKKIENSSESSKTRLENPYTSARNNWNTYLTSLLKSKQSWQFVALVSLFTSLLSISGLIMIANRSQYVPYVIHIDKLGQIHSIGPIHQSYEIDERSLKYTLAKFIENLRLVTPDRVLQRKAILDVYAHILPQSAAKNKIFEWYNNSESNVLKRAERELASINISDILQLSDKTWQISWSESITDHKGILLRPIVNMKAILTVEIVPPSHSTDEQEMFLNPLGIFVKDLSWSKVS